MSKTDLSRRKFLSRSALALPVAAAAIPAAMEVSSITAEAASVRQDIPNRIIPTRTIGTTTVTVSGLPTNEKDDCSVAIQSAINSLPTTGTNKGGTVIIPWHNTSSGNRCIYKLDCTLQTDGTATWGIELKPNVRLEFRPGVALESLPHNLARAYMVQCAGLQNVEIVNGFFVGERHTHTPSGSGTDEHVYGINVAGCTGVNILGTYVSDQNGDGVQIGGYNSVVSSDIVICDSILTGNRRQALSITGGSDISLYDSEFSYTYGTLPMNGIDVEPSGSSDVTNLIIDNCIVRGNMGNGIECNFHVAGTTCSNVTLSNSVIQDNYYNGFWTHMSNGATIDTGSIHGNAFFQNGNYGLVLSDVTTNYTVGGPGANGTWSNNFANNQTSGLAITYPNTNRTDTHGYVAGNDMHLGPNTLLASSGTVVNYNSYFTP